MIYLQKTTHFSTESTAGLLHLFGLLCPAGRHAALCRAGGEGLGPGAGGATTVAWPEGRLGGCGFWVFLFGDKKKKKKKKGGEKGVMVFWLDYFCWIFLVVFLFCLVWKGELGGLGGCFVFFWCEGRWFGEFVWEFCLVLGMVAVFCGGLGGFSVRLGALFWGGGSGLQGGSFGGLGLL